MGLPVLTGNETATIEQLEMQTTSTKKAPEGANLINGGNYVANIEPYLNKLKSELEAKTSQKVIYMLKFLQQKNIA